jgi:hypothetical protein
MNERRGGRSGDGARPLLQKAFSAALCDQHRASLVYRFPLFCAIQSSEEGLKSRWDATYIISIDPFDQRVSFSFLHAAFGPLFFFVIFLALILTSTLADK